MARYLSKFQEDVFTKISFQWILTKIFKPTSLKLYTQMKTLYGSSMTMYSDFFALYWFVMIWRFFCFSDFSCTLGLTSIVIEQTSKYFKNSFFSHRNRGSSVDKNGASMVSRLLCCRQSLHMSKSLSLIRQLSLLANYTINKTLLTIISN